MSIPHAAGQGIARRALLQGAGGAILSAAAPALAIRGPLTLWSFVNAPLLARFYRREPQGRYDAQRMVGLNIGRKTLVEEQRLGGEWVLRGIVSQREDWRRLGWDMLDIGVGWQLPDGGFQPGYFHSNSLFLAGLARACVFDPETGAASRYRACLARGCDWLLQPKNLEKGLRENARYTHREYILAACFGLSGAILKGDRLSRAAERFAERGLALQRPDGTNPELGGFDASYQMVGALLALLYYPYAPAALRPRLATMVKRASDRTLPLIGPTGEIDVASSTRAGHEIASGRMKQADYPAVFQAYAQADVLLPNPAYRLAAYRVAQHVRLPLPPIEAIPGLRLPDGAG